MIMTKGSKLSARVADDSGKMLFSRQQHFGSSYMHDNKTSEAIFFHKQSNDNIQHPLYAYLTTKLFKIKTGNSYNS